MITLPNGKTLMNEQEAIQWLLDNNPIPFQCSANYAAGTEIGLGTIINPSPARVRIGSLIFFADSKVSTVVGLTSNSFICSDEYNDLVDDIVYVSNVALNASGHLIVTLSNGDDIDAGLVKQISSFSINASQHLVATYNDGTSTDLGAIFTGNVSISGNLTADSIIENMTGYTFTPRTKEGVTLTHVYAGVVKNGNKITFVHFLNIQRTDTILYGSAVLASFGCPNSIMSSLYPYSLSGLTNVLSDKTVDAFKDVNATPVPLYNMFQKYASSIDVVLYNLNSLELNTDYVVRIEQTFLLSNNLAA